METNNYIKGILGAIIGGILFSLPWILVYVYANYILSVLATIIAFGALKFYKIFGGKVTKKTSIIIALASILSITIATFIIIPFWLVAKEGYGFNAEYVGLLYNSSEFVSSIIRDYIVSILFTILGISGVIANINKEAYTKDVKDGNESKTYVDDLPFEQQVKYLEEIYSKYNAFDKKSAVPESVILDEIEARNKLGFYTKMERNGIIVDCFTKSYFDKEVALNPEKGKDRFKKRMIKMVIIVILTIIALSVIIVGISSIPDNTSKENNYESKGVESKKDIYTYEDISIILPETFIAQSSEEDADNKIFINSGNDIVTQVMLQQVTLDNYSDSLYESYHDSYKTLLSDNFEIVNDVNNSVLGYPGFCIDMTYKEYKDEKYRVYVNFNKEKVYIIMFFTRKNIDLNDFYAEAEGYMNTVKFN